MNGNLVAITIVLFGALLGIALFIRHRYSPRLSSQVLSSTALAHQPILSKSQHAIDDLFDALPVALFQLEPNRSISRVNRPLQMLLGLGDVTTGLVDILHPEDVGRVEVMLEQLNAGYGESAICEVRLRHTSGHLRWVQLHIAPLRDTPTIAARFLVTAIDIGERKRAEQLFRAEEEKLEAMVEQLPVAVWMLSKNRDLMFINAAVAVLSGRSKEAVYGNPLYLEQLIHPDDMERVARAKALSKRSGSYEVSYRLLRDDGEIRYIREQGSGIYDERGNQLYQVCSATDISGEMIARDELHELNSRLREANLRLRESVRLDNLTGCLNRTALIDEAEKALQLELRYCRSSALVFFDLNDFKTVNDNFGHHIGDLCLIAFAEQVKARLRTTDELGRYGGDEFVALLRETDAEQALQLLSTLVPVVVDDDRGSSIILRFSAGVACSSDAEVRGVDDWLRIADQHMYTQKLRYMPSRQ